MQSSFSRQNIRPYQPVIGRKTLIMVAIPVLLGSCFLAIEDYLWYSSNSLIIQNQKRNELSITLNESFSALTGYGYTVMHSAFHSHSFLTDQIAQSRKDVEYQYAKLDHLLNLNVHDFDTERIIQHGLLDTLIAADAVDATSHVTRTRSNLQRVAISGTLMRRGLALSEQIQAVNRQQLANQMQMRKQQDALQKTLEIIAFATFGSGVLISIFLFLDFAKNILARLKVLTKNASSLARLEVPENRINGHDEIAYLDQCLGNVAAELKTAREEQKSIVQMIAHDIRSPIMATQVSVTTFEEFFLQALPERSHAWCAQVIAGCMKILNFVNELLTLETIESGQLLLNRSDVTINELAQECILSLSEQASLKSLVVQNNCSDINIKVDKIRILQVLSTYLANAIESAPAGSQVTIANQTSAQFVTVYIVDFGSSLTKVQISRAFERVKKVNADETNLAGGPGLYIGKELVKQHGGAVGVTSEPGKGREFYFSLPLSKSKSLHADALATNRKIVDTGTDTDTANTSVNKIRNSLVSKVFLLMLLPCIAQGATLIWLDSQLLKSHDIALRERHQADTVFMIKELWLRQSRASVDSAFYCVFQSGEYRDRALEEIKFLRTAIDNLDLQINDNSQAASLWHDTKDFLREETNKTEKRLQKSSDFGLSNELERVADFILPALNLNKRLATLTDQEVTNLAALGAENERSREQVQTFIILAIFFNVIVSALQWWALRRDITNRIAILIDNVEQLPERGQLRRRLIGSDEIVALDTLVHKASRQLNDADHQRKEMMDMISNNIDIPLVLIAQNLSLLEVEAAAAQSLGPKAGDNLAAARRNIDRVQMLSNDLFTIDQSKGLRNELEKRPCNVTEVIDEAVSSVASLASAKKIILQTGIVDVVVLLDRKRIIQVVVNLLANAIKFSPSNSTISISAKTIPGSVQILIQDQGEGMDEVTRKQIFDKFFRSGDQKQQAFGLGLAICKLIVDAHDGQISVESSPGKGSIFSITLPI